MKTLHLGGYHHSISYFHISHLSMPYLLTMLILRRVERLNTKAAVSIRKSEMVFLFFTVVSTLNKTLFLMKNVP